LGKKLFFGQKKNAELANFLLEFSRRLTILFFSSRYFSFSWRKFSGRKRKSV